MKKETKFLSGASQDAYFRRVLKADPNLTTEGRERIVRHLRDEIAQVRLRVNARRDIAASTYVPFETAPRPTEAKLPRASANGEQSFDPYSPNVVVVVRKFGSETAIAALGAIESIENLRHLAREQRLNVEGAVLSAAEIRIAIVRAAERRIANRMAAAS